MDRCRSVNEGISRWIVALVIMSSSAVVWGQPVESTPWPNNRPPIRWAPAQVRRGSLSSERTPEIVPVTQLQPDKPTKPDTKQKPTPKKAPSKPSKPQVRPQPDILTPPSSSSPASASVLTQPIAPTADLFAAATSTPSSRPSSYAPNHFGDIFGRTGLTLLRVETVRVRRPFMTTLGGVAGGSNEFAGNLGDNIIQNPAATLNGILLGPTQFMTTAPIPFNPGPAQLILVENPDLTGIVDSNFATPGETTSYVNGTADGNIAVTPNPQFLGPVTLDYLFESLQTRTTRISVASPTGGGVVGRTKIADDNNPMPRDRLILNYDYFDNVPLTFRGVDVNRFSPGFEKTFLDQNASIEVRFPFASTLNSVIQEEGITSTNTEFGNINITLKALLTGGPLVNVSSGLGISLPTADDTRVAMRDGTDLIRIRNQAVILTPFAAVLLTPNDRLFFQSWVQVGFDTNGSPLDVNLAGTGLRPVGRLTDQSLLQLDGQIGYWLLRNQDPSASFRGLAAFLELHYNTSLGDPDHIDLGSLTIGNTNSNIDELNLTAGITTQFGTRMNLSIGAVVPLKNRPDRTFDYQIGVRCNIFFGPTARDRQRATPVSSF